MTNEEIIAAAYHCFDVMRNEAERSTDTPQEAGVVIIRAVVAAWTLMLKFDPTMASTLANEVFAEREVGWRLVQSG